MLYQMKPRWPCFWTFLSKFVKININSIIEFVNELLHTYSGWKEPANHLVILPGIKTERVVISYTVINQNNVHKLKKAFDCKV